MRTPKQEVEQILNSVPDDASLEEIERRIHIRMIELNLNNTTEQEKLGEAGRRLAGRVWESEDFSDWEKPDAGR